MPDIDGLLDELGEHAIAQRVASKHDAARLRYALPSNVVSTFEDFTDIIADYYAYHFACCVSHGGSLTRTEAAGRAKELLVHGYRDRGGDIVAAFYDARYATNGGLRMILDMIADALKAEAVRLYVRDAFDRHVTPNNWEQKLEIIRQFLGQYGKQLGPTIALDKPEQYANDYDRLIMAYVQSLQHTASLLRRG